MQSNKRLDAEGLLDEANALWHAGKPRLALDMYRQSARSLGADAPAATVLRVKSALAICLRETGALAEALTLYPELEALCIANDLDRTRLLRQWSVALETAGEFRRARSLLMRVAPDAATPASDRLRWHHALGLLCWSEGRLADAAHHLKAATEAMPEAAEEAAPLLAVYGNEARLSLVLDNPARAYRLVDRMIAVREAAERVPLASETCLFIARAALAEHRRDFDREAEILGEAIDWIEQNDPEEWLNRLDLLGRHVQALQRAGRVQDALSKLRGACEEAPLELAWVGHTMLAQVQVETGDPTGARQSLAPVFASVIGKGSPEREVEVIMILADLAHAEGRLDAAAFLGKLAVRYMAELCNALSMEEAGRVLFGARPLIDRTGHALRAAGRYEEALALERVFDRLRRNRLVLSRPTSQAEGFDLVPFDKAERDAQADWLASRRDIAALRETASDRRLLEAAGTALDRLLDFRTPSGLGLRFAQLDAPEPGILRLAVIPSGDHVRIRYLWHDAERTVTAEISPADLFTLVSALREATGDLRAWREPATRLYDILIAPIERHLPEIRCLEVDAAGVLGTIPLSLLCRDTVCLAQIVPIRYVLPATPPKPEAHQNHGLLSLLALPHGPLLRAVKALPSTESLVGRDFTRDSMMAALNHRPAHIVVATHFHAESGRPDLSAFTLGDGEPLHLPDFGGDHFDFGGARSVFFASCSSAVADVTVEDHVSLAAILLEKGACCVIGTLWEITETAAARFLGAYWQAFAEDPTRDPAEIVTRLQADHAAEVSKASGADPVFGGIGSMSQTWAPENWAGFVVFQGSNDLQRPT